MQSPAFKRWKDYYGKIKSQQILEFAMCTVTERNVPHRLVVISSDGSPDMEAIAAALLNIRVDRSGNKSNAINRGVCVYCFKARLDATESKRHALALSKYIRVIEVIECVHCRKEILVRHSMNTLQGHICQDPDVKKRWGNRNKVYARLFRQLEWCPRKDTCKACIVIVPRPEDDLSNDLPLSEILQKNIQWKKERQRLVLTRLDIDKNKIMCMHCRKPVSIGEYRSGKSLI
jgi:uncharacterized CHY-type Zn-finger protein